AAYLNQGGSLYMEGGDTWYYDDQTAVHAMFNINATSDGSSDMSTVLGQAGTFTEGMSFPYNGENNWMDHIEPVSPAFKILQNQSPSYGTGVAYDAGTYKTIGTSHEFGGLQDGASPSTKEELMREYLIFLGVIPEGVTAGFTSNATQICTGDNVEFYDGSYGNIISWNWTFEGGTPGTSTQQNPVVTYNTTGSFDVTLIVSDGLQSDTLSMTDYIGVSAVPGVPGTPTGPTSLCLDPLNTTYNTSGATNATTYVWEITPANAGTITGTGTNATVNWDDAFTGAATIKVCGVNYCGNGLYSNALTVTVHPLPTVTLDPFPMVCVWEPPFMLTGGLPEGGEYSGTGVSNGWFDPAAAGVGTHTITYSYTDPNGCSNQAEQTIVVDPCTGILEYETDGLVHVYPNPNEGSFTVKMNLETQETLTIRLLNAMSEVVFEERHISVTASMNYELNLPGLNAGVYYLHVVGDKTLVTRKIIIR
ncbi:MAG: T9SS type A sorting domain-containing protein, partial [Bacteroidales bacterium]|nr:T9SS type A sorting domain-containing protein [Bacteroidales bacterium]